MNQNNISFAVLDIETTPFSETFDTERIEALEFILGCVIFFDLNGNEIKSERAHFYNVKELCAFLMKKCSKFPVYCHNLSFDFKFISQELLLLNSYFKIINTPSKTLCVKFFAKKRENSIKPTKTLEIRDSLSLLLSSVEKLGANIDLPKLEVENNDFANLDYCFRDCEIVGYSLFHLIDFVKYHFDLEINPRKIPLTIGSLAKKCFCKVYPNVFYKYDWKIHDHLRKYYYGGRTEVFDFNEIDDGVVMDIVSLYPFVACHYKLPNGQCYVFEIDNYTIESYCKFHNSNQNEKNFFIFGFECEVIENQHYPLFFERLDNRVVCANGKKTVFITLQEYRELKDLGIINNEIIILKPFKVIGCKKLSRYRKFFIPLAKVKKTTKSASEKYFCKIFMNSLTGKLGQKPERKDTTYYNDLEIKENQDFFYDIDLDCSYKERIYIQRYQTANLTAVIGITNLARFTLYKQIRKLDNNRCKVYYCDTDSLFINKKDINQFNISDKLGCWNIEHDNVRIQAIDAKEYILQGKNESNIKFKGLITKHFKTSDFYQHYKNGTITRLIPKIRYCDIRNISHESVVFLRKEKRQFYFKRLILNDLTTIPLNDKNLSISSIKKHNRNMIFNKIIQPNLSKIKIKAG